MAPSTCDQKKAEIVRLAEEERAAITKGVKATYELKCLEVEDKYKAKKAQAYRDLEQQKLEELGEIERLCEAELEPLKVKHAEELSKMREQYHIADPEAGLHKSALSETPSSLTLVTASHLAGQQQAEASNNDTAANNRPNDDTQESGDESDTSIPASAANNRPNDDTRESGDGADTSILTFAPQPTRKATFAAPMKKRKRVKRILDSDLEDSDSSQNKNRDEQDDTSDVSFPGSQDRPSEGIFKAFKGASSQRSGRNTMSSASSTKLSNAVESRNQANSFGRKTDNQTRGGDEEESTNSGPASQASRRNLVRPGRPEPGKYRMNASAWPV